MAEHLSVATKQAMMRVVAVMAAFCMPALGAAQSLSDPTRPPAGFFSPAAAPAPMEKDVPPVLQSILVSPRRTHAIINGKTVKLGDVVGEAKVVRITENEVVLRTGKASRVLKLYPEIEKQSGSGRKDAKRGMQQP